MLNFLRRKDREAERFADAMMARVESGVGSEAKTYASLWQRGLEHLLNADQVTSPVEQVGAVYVSVRTIATSATSHEWGLFDGDDEIDSEPLRDVLEMPSEHVIGTELLERTFMALETTGDCFWMPDDPSREGMDRSPLVRGFRALTGDQVEPIRAGVGAPVEGWRIDGKIVVAPEELVHFSYPHPKDPVMGLAPLRAARLGYSIQWKSSRWQEMFFEKGGVPPFWLKMPENLGALTPEERDRIRETFKKQYLGLRNAGEVPILMRGATLESLSVSQRDAEWIATQKLTTMDILSVFGVPPAIAGYFEDANRSNAREQKEFFWLRLLPPKLKMTQAVINNAVIPLVLGRDSRAQFKWKLREKQAEVLPEMVKEAIDSAKVLYEIGYPPSVATTAVGLEMPTETPDGEAIPGIHSPKPAGAPMMPPPIGDDSEPEEEADDTEPRSFPSAAKVMRDVMRRAYHKKQETLERKFAGEYGKFLKWLKDAALDSVSSTRDAGDPFPGDAEVGSRAAGQVENVVKESVEVGALTLATEINRDPVFDFLDPKVTAHVQARRIRIVGASTRFAQFLRDTIAEGVEAGETEEQLKRRVLDAFDGDRSNARTIARTESGSGFMAGRLIEMDSAGIEQHEWLTAQDERVRDSHRALDGEVRAVGEAFSNGLRNPSEDGGPAGEVINCRCVTLPIIPEDEDDA